MPPDYVLALVQEIIMYAEYVEKLKARQTSISPWISNG
jgi:hypothetical protein